MRLAMLCIIAKHARPLVCRPRRMSLATQRSAAAVGAAAVDAAAVDTAVVEAPRAIGDYVALPPQAADGLRALGLETAAPVQRAVWADAMGGASLCVHAPTGSGKTLAMVLPVIASTLWAGRGNPGRVVVLVPTRELVAQHETLLNALGARTAVVTSATVGAPGGAESLADEIEDSAVVLATPAELCAVLENRPELYGSLRCEALVCDELDLLMPSRKSSGAKVSRWQDKGDHPAEALVRLAAKRCGSSLQVLAGSATLDRSAQKKLDRALKGAPRVQLPLPVVAVDTGKSLVVKTKHAPGGPRNVRTTIAPRRVAHRSVTRADPVAGAVAALATLRPRVALVFVCSSSKLKVRAVAEELGARVLNDALFPSSARSRRRNYATKSDNQKKAEEKAEKSTDAEKRAAVTRAAAEQLRDDVAAATVESPVVLVASEDRARGLDIAGADAVLVLGGPANADTFVHLSGRVDRDPLALADGPEPSVVTIGRKRDLDQVRTWLVDLGEEMVELE